MGSVPGGLPRHPLRGRSVPGDAVDGAREVQRFLNRPDLLILARREDPGRITNGDPADRHDLARPQDGVDVDPQFGALLEACAEHPVCRVWVLHDDRLIREGDEDDLPRVIRVLAPRKITIRCVEAADIKLWQAEGKMSARIRNAVNGYESERKRERVMLATEDRARKGRFSGGQRRFGYRQRDTRIARRMDDDGRITEEKRPSGPLVLVPDEAQAMADGYRMITSGATLYALMDRTRQWRAGGPCPSRARSGRGMRGRAVTYGHSHQPPD